MTEWWRQLRETARDVWAAPSHVNGRWMAGALFVALVLVVIELKVVVF